MIQSNLNIDEKVLVLSYFGGGALGRSLKRAIKDGIEQVTKKASDTVKTFKLSKAIEEEAKKTPVKLGVTVSGPFIRVAPSDSRYLNYAWNFTLPEAPKSRFELILDIDLETGKPNNLYSIHFKTEGKDALNKDLKDALFKAVADFVPEGSEISTYGTLSKGGKHGVDRFGTLFGWPLSGTRTVSWKKGLDVDGQITKGGEPLELGIYLKPKLEIKTLEGILDLDVLVGAKDRVLYLTENDPYFIPQEPSERLGPYGTEILYGTRSANPWLLAMGDDMIYRLSNFGYNVEDLIPAKRNGNMGVYRPSTYVKLQAGEPIDMVVSSDIPSNVSGYHSSNGKNVYKVTSNTNGSNLQSTQIHESLMHGTEDLLEALGLIPSKPGEAATEFDIPWIYKLWADNVTSLPTTASKNSSKWYELRATLGELRTLIYKAMAKSKGKEFYKLATITPELRSLFESNIDRMNVHDIASFLRNINNYGKDYAEVLLKEAESGGTNKLDTLKSLIKYAPVVYYGVSNIPTNYVEQNYENLYKKGGLIHIKEKNKGKFTASAKKAGEGVLEHAHKVVNDPNATPLLKKRALFAINAKKWHH